MIDHAKREPGLVVVGASLAGTRAVQAARRAGYAGSIVLVGTEPHLPYDRPPLSKEFLTDGAAVQLLTEDEAHSLDVGLLLGKPATGLDPGSKTVFVGDAEVGYDKLIVATGAQPRSLMHFPKIPGIHVLRTLDDALALRKAFSTSSRVVVIGAGLIGSEIAAAAKSQGMAVTIVEAAAVPLVRAVGEEVGEALSGLHARNGVRLICGVSVDEVLGDERVQSVKLSDGRTLETDMVVVAVGAVPATGWLGESGVDLNPIDGGINCDAYLRSSVSDVYAAGDVAHWPNGLMDMHMRLENWTNAASQGGHAAVNALFAERATPYETVPYFWSDWYGHRIQFAGSAVADSVEFVSGDPKADRFVALFRAGDRLIGAATAGEPRRIMKLRRLIADRGSWQEALNLLAVSSVIDA